MDDSASIAAERVAETATKVSYSTSGVTLYFGLTLNDIGVIVGIVGTIVSIGVMIYYKSKHYRLEVIRLHHQMTRGVSSDNR